MNNNINAAINWLCESDILNKDRKLASFGGVNNAYIWKEKKYQYVYNEITGYAVNTFLSIYQWTKEEKYLQYAIAAADYLISQQSKNENSFEYGGISHSLVLPALNKSEKYYSFDNAIILHGISNLYQITKEKKYYEACINIGNFLLKMQKENGAFYSYYDAETKEIKHESDEFFFDNGCLHVKNTIGLFFLNAISKEKNYFQAGVKSCDWGLRLLEKDGLFWANTKRKYVFTHAHCYATEGYLYAYLYSKNPVYLNTARKAGLALIDIQNTDGSVYRIYKNKLFMKNQYGNKFKMSFKRWQKERKFPWKTIDASSQAARIWLLLYSIDKNNIYLESSEKAISFLKNNQAKKTSDYNMDGGFFYQLCDTVDGGQIEISRGMYTWCTQFSLSAFMLSESVKKNIAFPDLINMLY
jgi:rhamnogalacturonyl hydrolase YesR